MPGWGIQLRFDRRRWVRDNVLGGLLRIRSPARQPGLLASIVERRRLEYRFRVAERPPQQARHGLNPFAGPRDRLDQAVTLGRARVGSSLPLDTAYFFSRSGGASSRGIGYFARRSWYFFNSARLSVAV